MNRHRAVSASWILGGLFFLGTGAFTRAQSPHPEIEKPATPRAALRERLIELRSQVEVLQLEHDANKDDLLESWKILRGLQRESVDAPDEVIRDLRRALRSLNASPDQREKMEKQADLLQLEAEERRHRRRMELEVGVTDKKKKFARQTAQLNALKLELEDAEHRYAVTR